MESEKVTKKLHEVFKKWQAWADDIPSPFFDQSSWSDEFYRKITQLLREEIEAQHCSFGTESVYLPSLYLVQISQDDQQNFQGEKFELFHSALNRFLAGEFRRLGAESIEKEVQIHTSLHLERNDVNISSFWRETYSPEIRFNHNSQSLDIEDSDTIIVPPSFWNEINDGENETVVKSTLKRLFSLEIWCEGNYAQKNRLPIFKSKIAIGRSIVEDVPLQDDPEISRHHAVLAYQQDRFLLSVAGQNPVFVQEIPFFTGQTASCAFGETFQIGRYSLKVNV